MSDLLASPPTLRHGAMLRYLGTSAVRLTRDRTYIAVVPPHNPSREYVLDNRGDPFYLNPRSSLATFSKRWAVHPYLPGDRVRIRRGNPHPGQESTVTRAYFNSEGEPCVTVDTSAVRWLAQRFEQVQPAGTETETLDDYLARVVTEQATEITELKVLVGAQESQIRTLDADLERYRTEITRLHQFTPASERLRELQVLHAQVVTALEKSSKRRRKLRRQRDEARASETAALTIAADTAFDRKAGQEAARFLTTLRAQPMLDGYGPQGATIQELDRVLGVLKKALDA